MLINVPIESLEERYSAQWNRWWPKAYSRNAVQWMTIDPVEDGSRVIGTGEFLDVYGTNIYKTSQLYRILRMVKDKQIKDGDVLFFHDLWFPGLETLFYVRDAAGINFKIAGMLHAGTWDPHDFLTNKGMTRWARGLEECWLEGVDRVYVATDFHRSLLTKRCSQASYRKIVRTWFPFELEPEWMHAKLNLITFPHRLAPEKQPWVFDRVRKELELQMPTWRFVKTKEVCQTKQDYYWYLAHSRVAFSSALQETWGIAMQEAVVHDCVPIVPNRLSYVEIYPPVFRYKDDNQAVKFVKDAAENYNDIIASEVFKDLKAEIIDAGRSAADLIIQDMRQQEWRI
jgi:hypothetical protein